MKPWERALAGISEDQLKGMTDQEILALPGIGKRGLQAIRDRLGGDTPRKVRHSAADRLWLAGMAMQALIIKGKGGSMADAVRAADDMLEELSK
jgi:hypothetical protein